MKMMDRAWLELAGQEGLKLHDYIRYVDDDVRNCLQVLLEGWKWNGHEFELREG